MLFNNKEKRECENYVRNEYKSTSSEQRADYIYINEYRDEEIYIKNQKLYAGQREITVSDARCMEFSAKYRLAEQDAANGICSQEEARARRGFVMNKNGGLTLAKYEIDKYIHLIKKDSLPRSCFNAWKNLWKNTFNFKGRVSRVEYWKAIAMNYLFMIVALMPFSFIMIGSGLFEENISLIASFAFAGALNFPLLALYFRRVNDIGLKRFTSIYIAILAPVMSFIYAGTQNTDSIYERGRVIMGFIMATGFGSFFYGSLISMLLYGSPEAAGLIPAIGMVVISVALMIYGFVNRGVIARMFGGNR